MRQIAQDRRSPRAQGGKKAAPCAWLCSRKAEPYSVVCKRCERDRGIPHAEKIGDDFQSAQTEVRALFVRNLPYRVTKSELSELFGHHGEVRSVAIVFDRLTGRSLGYGFVTFVNEADAERALQALDGTMIANRVIMVRRSR